MQKSMEEYGKNRSVMPLDVWGCTRVTLRCSTSIIHDQARRGSGNLESISRWGLCLETIAHERGIPSKGRSSTCPDYVPALCTHRPSLLPIELLDEDSG